VAAAADEIVAGRSLAGRVPELWDGRASERILDVLVDAVPAAEEALAAAR
jgi:hypothetical protein